MGMREEFRTCARSTGARCALSFVAGLSMLFLSGCADVHQGLGLPGNYGDSVPWRRPPPTEVIPLHATGCVWGDKVNQSTGKMTAGIVASYAEDLTFYRRWNAQNPPLSGFFLDK